MMRLKIKLNLGNDLPPYKQDQVVDEPDEMMAFKLIGMGLAEEVQHAVNLPVEPAVVDKFDEARKANKKKPVDE